MSGINRTERLEESLEFVKRSLPKFYESPITEEHHKKKKEAIIEAFDVREMLILAEKLNLEAYEERSFIGMHRLIRRALARLLNTRYFDDMNLIAPIYSRISELEREVKSLKAELAKFQKGDDHA